MEMQEVKDWLNRGFRLDRELTALERSKMNLYLRAVSVTQRYDGEAVAGSKDPHKMESYLAYADLVERQAAKLADISAEIFRVITRVRDTRERTVLIHRYLNFMTWEAIGKAMDYSWRQVMRIHGAALRSVKKILEETEKMS